MPSILWLALALIFAPLLGLYSATMARNAEDGEIDLDYLTPCVGFVAVMAAIVGTPPLLGWPFDGVMNLAWWTCGTFAGPIAFITWLMAIPRLRRSMNWRHTMTTEQKNFGEVGSAE